jgi:serine/threonine-protein kinase
MELIEGETLARRLARLGPFPPAEAMSLVRELARALGAAHARGIYHRDIKPENVLLTRDGSAKLADFGIARLTEGPRDARETAAGVIFGTPQYMSPEQAAGQRQDGRCDVYALGVLLFELLTGAPPYLGASATHVLAAHLLSPVPRLPAQGPHGPLAPALADLVGRMMAKVASERPSSMAEVEAAIEAVLTGHELPPPRPRLAVRPWMRGVVATLAVAGVAALIALGVRGARPARPAPGRHRAARPRGRRHAHASGARARRDAGTGASGRSRAEGRRAGTSACFAARRRSHRPAINAHRCPGHAARPPARPHATLGPLATGPHPAPGVRGTGPAIHRRAREGTAGPGGHGAPASGLGLSGSRRPQGLAVLRPRTGLIE